MFFQGLIRGLSIAAPVGPIGLLCIQRTLAGGRLRGFVSGLGAATADSIYALIAAFGLEAVSSLLLGAEFWLRLAGGIFLVILGFKTARTAGRPLTAPAPTEGLFACYFSVLALTLANPATILSFLAIFSGLDVGIHGNARSALALVGGVFAGSAAWWLILSQLAGLLRTKLNDTRTRLVNGLAGTCLVALGLWSLYPLVLDRF